MDIVTNNFNDQPYFFKNRLPRQNYVAFRLRGTRSNRDAIGPAACGSAWTRWPLTDCMISSSRHSQGVFTRPIRAISRSAEFCGMGIKNP